MLDFKRTRTPFSFHPTCGSANARLSAGGDTLDSRSLLDLLRELRLAKKMNYPEPESVDLKMNSYEQQLREELRDELFALAEACPATESNPEDCPLHMVRKLNPAQQFQWFDALNEPGLAYLAAYHQVCLTTRLALNLDGNIR